MAPWSTPASRQALVFAVLGIAADLDLLVGRHSQVTHSLGMSLIVAGVSAVLLRGRRRWLTLALAAGAAYGSHVLLDWLGQDATPPFGIMALWPFSHEYFISHLDVFSGISREPWRPGALWHDVVSVLREVAILAPLAAAAWGLRGRPEKQVLPPGATPAGQEVHGERADAMAGRKSAAE